MRSQALIIDDGRDPANRQALAVLAAELQRGDLATWETCPRPLPADLSGYDMIIFCINMQAGSVRMAIRKILSSVRFRPSMPPVAVLLLADSPSYGCGAVAAFDEIVRHQGLRLPLPPENCCAGEGEIQRAQIRDFARRLLDIVPPPAQEELAGNTKGAAAPPPLYPVQYLAQRASAIPRATQTAA